MKRVMQGFKVEGRGVVKMPELKAYLVAAYTDEDQVHPKQGIGELATPLEFNLENRMLFTGLTTVIPQGTWMEIRADGPEERAEDIKLFLEGLIDIKDQGREMDVPTVFQFG